MTGKQVAVVVPTTLLARQHFKTFSERFRGFPVQVAQASRLVGAGRARAGEGGPRRRHASISSSAPMRCSARRIKFKRSRPGGRRRGAAFRRRPQGAAQGAARRGPCADADGDADPAHPAAGADRRARTVDHRLAAGRPAGGAHLRRAVRSADGARGAAARALSRRPVLLCLPAHRGSGRGQGVPRQERAGGARRRRPRPDAGGRARGRHVRLLRRQVRRAAVDHDRRIRARHSDRQHADRAPRRHVRPRPSSISCAAGSAAPRCAPMRC